MTLLILICSLTSAGIDQLDDTERNQARNKFEKKHFYNEGVVVSGTNQRMKPIVACSLSDQDTERAPNESSVEMMGVIIPVYNQQKDKV